MKDALKFNMSGQSVRIEVYLYEAHFKPPSVVLWTRNPFHMLFCCPDFQTQSESKTDLGCWSEHSLKSKLKCEKQNDKIPYISWRCGVPDERTLSLPAQTTIPPILSFLHDKLPSAEDDSQFERKKKKSECVTEGFVQMDIFCSVSLA